MGKISFFCHGKPQPQGSTKAFVPKGWTRPIITSDNKSMKPWRQDLSAMAGIEMQRLGLTPTLGPVKVTVQFFYQRPKSTKRSVVHKTTKPDLDKLERCVFDSMTGIVYKDDSQIVDSHVTKQFIGNAIDEREGAYVEVEFLGD